jgi:hypothetical protein
MASTSNSAQFNAAMDKYYKLKHNYQLSILKAVTKIRNNDLLTTAEKQEKFATLTKKCINCGKNGGTIFKQEGNLLIAECGHIEKPCKLNIKLQYAKYKNLSNEISKMDKIVNNKKIGIIQTKLNFLFGFTDEPKTIGVFNEFKGELVSEVKKYQKINEIYMDIVENLSNKEEIKKLNNILFALIQNFKDLIKNYDETGQNQYLNDAANLYVNEIVKITQELQNLKYRIQYVYTDYTDDTYHLVQETYTPSQLQVIVPGTENKIIEFSV